MLVDVKSVDVDHTEGKATDKSWFATHVNMTFCLFYFKIHYNKLNVRYMIVFVHI